MKKSLSSIKTIIIYSIKMFFRDKTAIFFSLFLPIVIMSIFGVMDFGGTAKVKMGVVDEAKNQLSAPVVEGLKKVSNLEITEKDLNTEKSALENGERDIVIILPQDFGQNIGQLKTGGKPTPQEVQLFYNSNKQNSTASIGITIVNQVLDRYTHAVAQTPDLFILKQEAISSKNLTYIDFLIPGVVALGIMQMSVFGVVSVFVTWRDSGVLRRLLATPVRPRIILFSQVITRLIISVMQTTIVLTVGVLFFGIHIVGSIPLIFLLGVLGGIVFLCLGFAISGVGNSTNTVMALANVVMMPQMFLAGVFFPRDGLPEWLKTITSYLPLTYLADALRSVIIDGSNIVAIRGDILGLLVWIVITFILAIKFFRWE
ncbi:MAG: ABC transporter permease [Patescibacteria group bacterium]